MFTVMNDGVKMRYKSVTVNLVTVVGPLVESSITAIANTEGSLEAYLSIRENPITVTSNRPVIPPYLPISLFFSNMLIPNSRSH